MKKIRFYFEKLRLKRFPRYKSLTSNIFNFPIVIADKSSFASMYQEIFIKEIYKFKSKHNNPLIIDCGSNIGLSIIYFKKLFPESTVIGFEPDPRIFKILEKNLSSAKIVNTTLINKALGDKEGVINFFSEGADGGRIAQENDGNVVSLETMSLRSFLNQKVDFLKIDIEGSETLVLKDCQDLLKNVDRIFIEYHSVSEANQTLDEILRILNKNKFRYYMENTGIRSEKPFIKINTHLNYDLQLNIFANKYE